MRLFTFIVERAGGTYCSQHSSATYHDAAASFVNYASDKKELFGESLNEDELTKDALDTSALSGLVNIRCFDHLDGDEEFWLVNVVETVVPEGATSELAK